MTRDSRPAVRDYSLLFPLLVGVASLLGIGLIFASNWLQGQETPAVSTPSVAPKYRLIATDVVLSIPQPKTVAPTEIPTGVLFTPTITITPPPIFTQSMPLMAGTYDDRDSHIVRAGNWSTQQNVRAAFQETLLVSSNIGDYVAFSFIGKQMVLGYKTSQDAGSLTVEIDGSKLNLLQSIGTEWVSAELISGMHFVILTHQSGASVNFDYIDIPS